MLGNIAFNRARVCSRAINGMGVDFWFDSRNWGFLSLLAFAARGASVSQRPFLLITTVNGPNCQIGFRQSLVCGINAMPRYGFTA